MFVELMPLLMGRTILITVAREDEKTIRVCVIPKKVKEDDHPAIPIKLEIKKSCWMPVILDKLSGQMETCQRYH